MRSVYKVYKGQRRIGRFPHSPAGVTCNRPGSGHFRGSRAVRYDQAMDRPESGPASLDWSAVRSWRVHARRALIKARLNREPTLRDRSDAAAKRRLVGTVGLGRYPTLGIYSPMRGEIDLLDLAAEHVRRGGRVGLPVVVEKAAPVEFWRWWPGMSMSRGIWNIAIPATKEPVEPDALIVPLVGFDPALYRLGYGGGYYDRTLQRMAPKPFCVGIGSEGGKLPSIFPQAHDIPMDLIVTEEQVYSKAAQPSSPGGLNGGHIGFG